MNEFWLEGEYCPDCNNELSFHGLVVACKRCQWNKINFRELMNDFLQNMTTDK